MAKHYLGLKQMRYVVSRAKGMNMTDAYMKAFNIKKKKSATACASKLEKIHPLIKPAIIAELDNLKSQIQDRQEDLMAQDLTRIKDVIDLEQVKSKIQMQKDKAAQTNHNAAKVTPSYDATLEDQAYPPTNCTGRTYQGIIPRPEKKRKPTRMVHVFEF